jgi:hypothetical protein
MYSTTQNIKSVGTALASVLVCMLLAVCFAVPNKAFAAEEIPVGDISDTGYSDQITIKVDGTNISATFTRDDLKDLLNSTPVACNFLTNNQGSSSSYYWKVLAAKNYINLTDLFALAKGTNSAGQEINAASYWKSGARLEFTAYSEPYEGAGYYENSLYDKWSGFTFDNLATQTKFFKYLQGDGTFYQGNSAATSVVPLAIAFDRISERVNGLAESTFNTIKNSSSYTATTQFVMGLDLTTVNVINGQGDNMGKRLPQGITAITIYPN